MCLYKKLLKTLFFLYFLLITFEINYIPMTFFVKGVILPNCSRKLLLNGS